jgi:hypothetical protein
MKRLQKSTRHDEAGYALLAVVVFVMVIIIAGMAFFAMSSYETKGAMFRQSSSEAFYLADGAVERARARFLNDKTWRDGWLSEAAGRGTYDLAVQDTAFQGHSDAVQLVATGHVDQADRRIEVMALLPPSAYELALLIMGDADAGGNLCINGKIHVNGDADFGNNDSHLACGGEYTEGFEIIPPYIYTDQAHFPDATYYDVFATNQGGVPHARIWWNGMDITPTLGDSLQDIISYNPGTQTFTYTFNNGTLLDTYFDQLNGVFHREAGDVAVVVNFGEAPIGIPNGVSSIVLDGPMTEPLHTTIINSRFIGTLEEQRADYNAWIGGLMTVKQLTWEPFHGVAAIAGDFQKVGGSLADIGTVDWPALLYITKDVEALNANFDLNGGLICLGDWSNTGGPNIAYDPGFLEHLPQYLADAWNQEVSGTMHILRWREIAYTGN